MKQHHHITANSAWLYRLFTLGPSRISLDGETIQIEQSPGDVRVKIPVVTISSITVRRSWFWRRLTIRQSDGIKRSIGGLDRRKAELIRDAALEEAERIHKLAEAEAVKRAEEVERIHKANSLFVFNLAVAEAIRKAKVIGPRLTQLDEELRQLFAGDHYARYHNSLMLYEAIAPILQQCEGLIQEYLEQEAREALGRLELLAPFESFEAERRKANSLFVFNLAVAEAIRKAKVIGPRLTQLDEELRQLFTGDRYVRYRDSLKLHEAIAPTLLECEGLIREHLEQEAREALDRLELLAPFESFEAERRKANSLFISKNVPTVQAAASETLWNPLTNEQAEAVATDEDVTLVLAGAGTGKTSVIVGKVAHLVRNLGVPPNQILVLAFNHKAADEIRRRLKGDLSAANVRTFHGFGYRVIADVEKGKPTLAEEFELPGTLKDILNELLNDPQKSDAIADFITSYYGAYESVFDFDTQEDYDEYIRSVELQSLSGAQVRSFEELEIANYLTKRGVNFCYERPYPVRTQTREYRQYHPDFFLPDYNIYIEHQALDKSGNPPHGWKRYKEKVEWQRQTHEKHGTKLIETYSWQHWEGILLDNLGKRLKKEGVHLERVSVSQRKSILILAQQLIESLARLILKFLNHVKTNNLSPELLLARAAKQGMPWLYEAFLRVFEQVRARYEQRLRAQKRLDFHDLINRAAHYIREGNRTSQYRYVLVDEFQDISAGRMKLLETLKRDDTAYFLVGDDWQSINRFAGSDVGLLRNCRDYLGHVQTRTLTKSFRFGEGILTPSTEFVRRNPEQTQRTLTSASSAEDKGITVVAADNPFTGLQKVREEIATSERGNGHSILVLGRYNASKDVLQSSAQWEFSTVHRAKGREADYVVVLDLKDGRRGFPSRVEDNSLLELVLPPISGNPYPFAEERRLFYVAMTRARIGAYLIIDRVRPSMFVTELCEQPGGLRQLGTLAPECPGCNRGRLVVRNSWRGKFLGCTEYGSELYCRYTEKYRDR